MEYLLMPLKRYADIKGRSRRKEYWTFTLFIWAIIIIIGIIFPEDVQLAKVTQNYVNGHMTSMLSYGLYLNGLALYFVLLMLIPGFVLNVRRFHDINLSGWFLLLNLIPLLGTLIVLGFMMKEGTHGQNRFGEDPKSDHLADVFS